MHTRKLRRVGAATMLAVPDAFLKALRLQAGDTVAVSVDRGRVIVEAQRPRYTLAELLAESDYSRARPDEEQPWLDAPAVDRELL